MENQVNAMPRIGDLAPAFQAVTTQGTINFPADYKGKWVVLYFYPKDNSPGCTEEARQFKQLNPEFLNQ